MKGGFLFQKWVPAAGEGTQARSRDHMADTLSRAGQSCGVAKRSRGCGSFFTSRQGQSFCTSRTVRWYTASPESGSVRVTVTVSISRSWFPGISFREALQV